MHIPPYYKKPGWQRFMVGVFAGALVSYLVVIYMYGTMYERVVRENYELKAKVTDLQKQKDALLEDENDEEQHGEQDGKSEPVVEELEIRIKNAEELKLDPLIIHQLSDQMKKDLDQIIGLQINIVGKSDELIVSTIESKTYHVDDFSYTFKINRLVVTTKLKLVLEAKIEG
ncbi:hypothetical protein P5G51_007990 [Virgibacillus sp. 179-BFC.A HS]|uniref:Sporulation membrane protein YtrI C-terminal domain-containing protein n=1 Tax=Tigheibacillus jepli TaxID=3035914 RepID=A0ABU5CHQ6_9BACI|nr:sporulation membrane protein YtrI [Virgibacillus sp. 179-BFC.A HS]MDY0405344.1 hypothetical protein [Virgibacillus sp. 179-BFC.A HS]